MKVDFQVDENNNIWFVFAKNITISDRVMENNLWRRDLFLKKVPVNENNNKNAELESQIEFPFMKIRGNLKKIDNNPSPVAKKLYQAIVDF